jgi:hypothetical protein
MYLGLQEGTNGYNPGHLMMLKVQVTAFLLRDLLHDHISIRHRRHTGVTKGVCALSAVSLTFYIDLCLLAEEMQQLCSCSC